MKYITTILKNLIPKKELKPVGRWRVENCNKQMNYKIDLSNEDHCGTCNNYNKTIDIKKIIFFESM